jgi:predicted ATP-grasp superfamily ATP-dependent carboligase
MKESLPNPPSGILQLQVADAIEQQTHRMHPENNKVSYDVLVVDARLRQSLVTLRSLGQRGKLVAALEVSNNIETSNSVPAFSSRWCQQKFIAPSFEQDTEPFYTYLEQVLNQTGAQVLITSSDGTLEVLRKYRNLLEPRVRIALAKEPALSIATNKDLTLDIAAKLGIGVPRGVNISSANEVTAALHEIGLPAVVKPVESWIWGEQKGSRLVCKLVTTPEEARLAVEELTASGGSVLFQQFLSGEREAINLLYANGEIFARFAQWAKRTAPPLGGISVYRQSIALPADIGEQTERLVREIDLEGYSEVEFRRDSEGHPYLMEINPRLSASVEVAVRAGVDFPYLLYQWARGDRIDHVKGYRVGGWMRFLEGDIIATAQALTQRGRPGVAPPTRVLVDFFLSFFIPSGYDHFNWKDPHPAWIAAIDFAGLIRRRLTRGFSKR